MFFFSGFKVAPGIERGKEVVEDTTKRGRIKKKHSVFLPLSAYIFAYKEI